MNKKITLRIVVGTIAAIGLLSVALYAKDQRSAKADQASAAAEQQFMEQMTSHHMDAIQMAQMAEDKAKTQMVRSMAIGIVTAQTKEVADMKTWYKQWFAKDMPEMAAMPGMMDDGMDMGKLSASADFDLEFVTQMIAHHQKAVEMAKSIKVLAKHQELKTLADNIISSQSTEIQQMDSMKAVYEKNPVDSPARNAIDQN